MPHIKVMKMRTNDKEQLETRYSKQKALQLVLLTKCAYIVQREHLRELASAAH